MKTICDSCHAGCCRIYRLLITVFDFVDLVNGLGIEKAIEGTCFETFPSDLNYTANKHSTFPFIFDNANRKGFMYSLALKRTDSSLFPGTQKCFFLTEELRPEPIENPDLPGHKFHPGSKVQGKCSIYAHRPNVCSNYPMAFNPNTFTSQLKRRDSLPQAAAYEGYQICPKQVLQLSDFGINGSPEIMAANNQLLLGNARIQAHNEIATKWNSQSDRMIENVVAFILSNCNSSVAAFMPPVQAIAVNTQEAVLSNKMDSAFNALKARSHSVNEERLSDE